MAVTSAARRDDNTALTIDLYGDARNTAAWIADEYGVTPGDVIARALGLLYFLVLQDRKGRRASIEDPETGERRQININLKAGDAGPNLLSSG